MSRGIIGKYWKMYLFARAIKLAREFSAALVYVTRFYGSPTAWICVFCICLLRRLLINL